MFVVLLSFSISLATKCLFFNDDSCMVRPALVDMNPVEHKYYPFVINLNIFTGSCIVLPPKICVPKETKDINIKAFNMITNKKEAEAMTEHISCDYKCKFYSTKCCSNQNWNNKTCQCECKNFCKCKKDYSWNSSICICENSKHLKSIADTSVIEFDEIVVVMDIVSTKKANTIVTKKINTTATNVMSTASTNK